MNELRKYCAGWLLLISCFVPVTGGAVEVDVVVSTGDNAKIPTTSTNWQAATFPLRLDADATRCWLKIPLGDATAGQWLQFGWPNVWQWQLITKLIPWVQYADGTMSKWEPPETGPIVRMSYSIPPPNPKHGAAHTFFLQLDKLPYQVCLPTCSFVDPDYLQKQRVQQVTFFSMYAGMLIVLISLAAVLGFVFSARIFAYYIAMLVSGAAVSYLEAPVIFSADSLQVHALFCLAMACYYISTFLFAGAYLDPDRKHRMVQGILAGLTTMCAAYIAIFYWLPPAWREGCLFGLDLCALCPFFLSVWLWARGSRTAGYYALINMFYLPLYVHFVLVVNGVITPQFPMYSMLICGAVLETVGYSVALVVHLWFMWQQKVCVEAENQQLLRREMESVVLARDAELRMLRFQMNPHFLFNALNSLIAEIGECPQQAVEMARKLSEFLRYTLSAREWSRVKDELEAVRRYLELETFRYEDKLQVKETVDEAAGGICLPMFTLQPLVENAIKYGMQTSQLPLQVGIDVQVEGEMLCIRVSNTGHWMAANQQSTGIGLNNIRERLKRVYDGQGALDIRKEPGQVVVCLNVPMARKGE